VIELNIMGFPCKYLTGHITALICLVGLLAACTPPSPLPQSGSVSGEMGRLQATVARQEQDIADLSRQLAALTEQQQQQADEIAQLQMTRQAPLASEAMPVLPRTTGSSTLAGQAAGTPTEVYLQAFGDYASGRYQAAIRGFETFLLRFPNNSYTSNAQFWLADAYFNQQQYQIAIREFQRVLDDYTEAPKSSEALYKIAVSELQLGQSDAARQTVAVLNQRYPKSTATQKAQELVIP
jgi:tol-pal system protein YbgF